jgi:hypothetical protein
MAVGGYVGEEATVEDSAYMTIQPGAGVVWQIKNMTWGGLVSVEVYDGTLSSIFHTDAAAGALLNMDFKISNAHYLRILNTHVSNHIVCTYNGIIWSE